MEEEEEDDDEWRQPQFIQTFLTIRNFKKTLKNRNKMKSYKINIFKHETRKGNTVK